MSNQKINKNEDFIFAYQKLNSEQKKAVDTIEGSVMVIAGPGTGKTQILTLRIANILLKTDSKPENILALTFTDSGVRAMRARMASFIGADAYNVPIHTFHSFSGDLIRRYPDSYENIVGGRPATELEKISIIEDLLDSGNFKNLRPHGDHSYYVKPILGAIATLKKENVSPNKFSEFISKQIERLSDIEKIHTKGAHKGKVRKEYLDAEKFLNRNQELLNIYKLYILELRTRRLYDYEDMILDTISALENNQDMLFDVQEQYQYILADEHQDVNQSQNRLIELMASYHKNPNVFVVGDEKQAIYRFQGASLENFLFFENTYNSAETIALTNNYRSDQVILDLAHQSIATDDSTLKKLRVPLVAKNQYKTLLTKQNFSHSNIEDAWVVDEIMNHHKNGVPWQEIAVIVRTNKEIVKLTSLMRKAGIPVLPSVNSDILTHPIFNSIKNLLRAVVEIGNEAVLAEVLQSTYLGIEPNDLIKVLSAQSFSEPLSFIISSEDKLKDIGVSDINSFIKINSVFQKAREESLTKTPAEILEYLLQESGFLNFVLKQNIFDGVNIVRRFYDEVELMFQKREALNLKSVLAQIALNEKYEIALTAPSVAVNQNAVNLITAHKAKGLEFEVVFIPHLSDNVWGGTVRSDLFNLPITKIEVDTKAQVEDDERRLFYVAMTRAKRVLQFSYSKLDIENRELNPSRFLVELESYIDVNDVSKYEENFNPVEDLKTIKIQNINTDFLRIALAKNGWSATSFNNYHKSPWNYIYKNALKIPSIKSPELQFGSAVHAVLERVVNNLESGNEIKTSEIKKFLDQTLGKSYLSPVEFTRVHERAFEAIISYLPILETTKTKTSKVEYPVKFILETGLVDFPEVILKGNFDRLDFDEFGKVIRVVDYKTGKTKTRGEIEGKTKNSDGNYKRQLVFYALLLSLHKDHNFHCRTGLLSFVEPDNKGKIHQEQFEITDEEIESLKTEIIEATKAVVTGSCLEVVCDEKKCEYCHLIDIFKKLERTVL